MGITNQAEIEKQQRHAAYLQVYFDLMKVKDRFGIPAFKTPEAGDAVQVVTKINQLMEHVNHLVNMR